MDTVALTGGQSYSVYGTFAASSTYWAGLLGPAATRWNATATTNDDRKRALNQATLLIDRQQYVADADSRGKRDAIAVFAQVCYEIAGALLLDPSLWTQISSGSNVKKVSPGGGVDVEFFNPTLWISGRFPIQIQELIGPYLLGEAGVGVSGSFSSGTTSSEQVASSFGDTSDPNPFGINRSL